MLMTFCAFRRKIIYFYLQRVSWSVQNLFADIDATSGGLMESLQRKYALCALQQFNLFAVRPRQKCGKPASPLCRAGESRARFVMRANQRRAIAIRRARPA
jgi:hypothetical protein